ncbi:predicted protein [Nematostella vectensis]|uniref:G-protein coupled receptors family 1 profile domain-containing protein n=1 Tax=Nematostella vectensis TaxID=45351 RepID=A7RHI8_NEMVE|nr:predicted protein [Nematostella vectensis]|eukprot:XP_001640921.1 predicted protein [Nematostella vectensis]
MNGTVSNNTAGNVTATCAIAPGDTRAGRIGQITACSLLMCIALVGNATIVLLVCKKKEMRRNVNIFIANMAVADSLVIISGLSVWLKDIIQGTREWLLTGILGDITCKIEVFLPNMAHLVSLLTLLLISIERYRVVTNPTGVVPMTKQVRCILLVAAWMVPCGLSAFYLVFPYTKVVNNQTICGIENFNPVVQRYALFIVVLSVALLITLLVVNLFILRRLRQARVASTLPATQRRNRERRVKNAVAMVLCSVLFYVLLWSPQRLVYMLIMGGYADVFEDPCMAKTIQPISFALNFFVYMNPACSPLIYFTFLKDFRNGLRLMCFPAVEGNVQIENTQEIEMDDRN